jgi:acetylglutamate kinase
VLAEEPVQFVAQVLVQAAVGMGQERAVERVAADTGAAEVGKELQAEEHIVDSADTAADNPA